MTRRAAKVDSNHGAVRNGLRALGWTVEDFSHVGGGVPDLFVSIGPALPFAPPAKFRGVLNERGFGAFVEVKAKGGALTEAQAERAWTGTRAPLVVGETVEEIAAGLQSLRGGKG